jgi:hypothetical protein
MPITNSTPSKHFTHKVWCDLAQAISNFILALASDGELDHCSL